MIMLPSRPYSKKLVSPQAWASNITRARTYVEGDLVKWSFCRKLPLGNSFTGPKVDHRRWGIHLQYRPKMFQLTSSSNHFFEQRTSRDVSFVTTGHTISAEPHMN